MKIGIKKEGIGTLNIFEGEEYIIDLDRNWGFYKKGDLTCYVDPFVRMPLRLIIAIQKDGSLSFRRWEWRQ